MGIHLSSYLQHKMNRSTVFIWTCAVALAAVMAAPRDAGMEFDPPETLVHEDKALLLEELVEKNGVHGQHNIPPPEGTKGVSDMQEDLLQDPSVAPLYEQEDDLYQSLIQRPTKDELAKDCAPDKICNTLHIPRIVRHSKNILTKDEAFTKMLSVASKAVKKAIKVTRKLLGKQANEKAIAPKQMVKNAMYLKAFAMLNADKLYSRASHLGALGGILSDMSTKSKKTPLEQYADSMLRVSDLNNGGGMGEYTLKNVATAMMGKGLVSTGRIGRGTFRQYVKISARDIGLVHHYPLLTDLASTVGFFVRTLQILDKQAIFALKGKPKGPLFTEDDFKRLFRASCFGTGENYNFCYSRHSKAQCAKTAGRCKWIGAWTGKLAQQVQVGATDYPVTTPGSVAAWL